MLERDRRMVSNLCLDCGKKRELGHKCGEQASTFVTCKNCDAQNRLSDRGVVLSVVRPRIAMAPILATAPSAVTVTATRARPQVHPQPQPPSTPRGDRCAKVLVNGVKYTALSWYLGLAHPYPRHRNAVLRCDEACRHAVQIRGGVIHTLRLARFAAEPPLHAKELLEDNASWLTGRWSKTKCTARRERGEPTFLEVKRVNAKDFHQKLFRYDDLANITPALL